MSMRDDRVRPRRTEEKSHHGRGNNPPSRHLWVGNLSHSLTESAVARQFLQFGDLESIAFQPGRSYAFVNFRNEEDAFAAIKELQGFSLAGNPLKIEFAKAEKSLPTHDDSYTKRDSPFSYDSRARHSSPERSYTSKSKMNDNEEPSEVLWIGFPAQLKVDEFVLRKAFSPFGELEKITSFPGRTYAFVRFRNVMSACRAKETLQGKLLANPRVRICFARSDGTSSRERDSMHAPSSPRGVSYGHPGSYENFHSDRNFDRISADHDSRSPLYAQNHDPRDHHEVGVGKNANLWHHGNDDHDSRRFLGQGSELGLPRVAYEPQGSPRNRNSRFCELSPSNFHRQGSVYDEPWELPEDVTPFHDTKKLKTSSFRVESELPEYPFSGLAKEKRIGPPSDIPASGIHDRNYDSRHSGMLPVSERLFNTNQSRSDHWNASRDDFQAGTMPLSIPDRGRLSSDAHGSSTKEVWKWEGVIAKGGTAVCGARCFPVGKPPDMVLPEYIDCTARTSLEMLAKHYYQATSAWVVFFVPANDPDIVYYNEFMNYLGEKQRAAVAKLDDRTTLFLVPPSEFSEKVLKVPGKLSISGVVLRLDPAGTNYGPSFNPSEAREMSFSSDLTYQKPASPSGTTTYLPAPPFSSYDKPGMTVNDKFLGASQSIISNVQSNRSYFQNTAPVENWVPHDYQVANSVAKNAPLPSTIQIYNPAVVPQSVQEASAGNYAADVHGNGKPVGGLPVEQLAQLSSSLLGQQGQVIGTGEYKHPSGNMMQLGHTFNASQNSEALSDPNQLQFGGQRQQLQQSVSAISSSQVSSQMSQQVPIGEQGETDVEPQKRLQATLQLAASLLHQIQQGKGN